MDQNLENLTTIELHNLFLKESQLFLSLLNDKPDSKELQVVKDRVKKIMDILDSRKKGG